MFSFTVTAVMDELFINLLEIVLTINEHAIVILSAEVTIRMQRNYAIRITFVERKILSSTKITVLDIVYHRLDISSFVVSG